MKSGDPSPIEDLMLLIETKRHSPSDTLDVVSSAARWLKSALKGAEIDFQYSSCDVDYYGFSSFTITRIYEGQRVVLNLKIAEIRSSPYVFAEVHAGDQPSQLQFPFFGNIRSDDDRDLLLHYTADFILSTTPA
ncbi:hypothetical protein Q31b_48390 [Novipirellula aureliae]|uniref:Uncharacterized protein n=1 Tax=Novipirellula aureliae TaxID=2527966 RepID=A0A5C6DIM2_9BACT|nr:hypothetical protein [Novipirellula aureliae]TWU36558.1 hypothetical protein Q31b_48390 [Novipirellula aureliae]